MKPIVNKPNIKLTRAAFEQLIQIKQEDYTLENQVFRIHISGKGCDGFTYSLGFTPIYPEDIILEISQNAQLLNIHMDPFSAFYTQNAEVDYLIDRENSADGFILTNHHQLEHRGKFYKDLSKLPPWAINEKHQS